MEIKLHKTSLNNVLSISSALIKSALVNLMYSNDFDAIIPKRYPFLNESSERILFLYPIVKSYRFICLNYVFIIIVSKLNSFQLILTKEETLE